VHAVVAGVSRPNRVEAPAVSDPAILSWMVRNLLAPLQR
jgi:hypothetical protein